MNFYDYTSCLDYKLTRDIHFIKFYSILNVSISKHIKILNQIQRDTKTKKHRMNREESTELIPPLYQHPRRNNKRENLIAHRWTTILRCSTGRGNGRWINFTPKREREEVKISARRSLKDTRPLTPLGTPTVDSPKKHRGSPRSCLKLSLLLREPDRGISIGGWIFHREQKDSGLPGFNELADFRCPISPSQAGNVTWAAELSTFECRNYQLACVSISCCSK